MKKGKLIDSFGYAIVGIFFCLRHERNMKIHYLAAVVVICCGFLFPYYKSRMDGITYCNGNCNEFRDGKYGCGKNSRFSDYRYTSVCESRKDVAAGAVLLFAIIAVIIGAIIFFTVCGIVAFQSFS